jgi:hypothetical protein
MSILVKKSNNGPFYESRVIETSLGHPSIPKLRIGGGYSVTYGKDWRIYEDNNINRTEILLDQESIKLDITLS